MLSVTYKPPYAECHYAECRYAECRGPVLTSNACIHAPMRYSQNALAYFAATVNYVRKMFMKLTTGACILQYLFRP